MDAIAKPFQEHEATVISAQYKYSAATNPDVQKKRSRALRTASFPVPSNVKRLSQNAKRQQNKATNPLLRLHNRTSDKPAQPGLSLTVLCSLHRSRTHKRGERRRICLLALGLLCASRSDTATASKVNDRKLWSFPPPGSDSVGHPKALKVRCTFSGQSKAVENDIAE